MLLNVPLVLDMAYFSYCCSAAAVHADNCTTTHSSLAASLHLGRADARSRPQLVGKHSHNWLVQQLNRLLKSSGKVSGRAPGAAAAVGGPVSCWHNTSSVVVVPPALVYDNGHSAYTFMFITSTDVQAVHKCAMWTSNVNSSREVQYEQGYHVHYSSDAVPQHWIRVVIY